MSHVLYTCSVTAACTAVGCEQLMTVITPHMSCYCCCHMLGDSVEESQSLLLRQQGNEAFKAGQHQQAIDLYWQAVSKNPEDYALFNNISLAALKLGDFGQVMMNSRVILPHLVVLYASTNWVSIDA